MSIRHTLMKGVALSTLLLLFAGPAGAATSDTTTRGTATTTSVPLHVEALNLPVDLGSTTLLATTDSDRTTLAPWSTVQLTLANLGGARFGEVSVSSDGTTTNPGTDVSRDTVIGAFTATAGSVLALADASTNSARAELTTLTTDATLLLNALADEDALNLEATITDVATTVNDGGAAATHSLTFAGIDLGLAHVLGNVLAELPLQDLLTLAGELGVDVPVNLGPVHAVVTATEELVHAVTAAVDAADAVEAAAQALLDADGGTLAELQGLLTDLETLALLDLVDFLLSDPLLEDCIGVVTIEAAETCIEGLIEDHLSTLTDELEDLETAVTNYVNAVDAAAKAAADGQAAAGGLTVSDILADIEELIADLLAADLLAVTPVNVSQQVRAVGGQVDDSYARHTCDVTTIAAVGTAPVEIADCDGTNDTLATVVDTITGTLQTVLDTVGGVDGIEGISLELFGTVEDTVTEDGDGWVRATSVMEVLALTVPDITVAPCEVADGLVCGLGLDIDGTLETVFDALDGVLITAQETAEGAINSVSDLLTALDADGLIADVTGVDAGGAQTAVNNAVTALTDVLNSLIDGLGDLGTAGGATVPGVKIVVDPTVTAEHQVTTASVDDPTPADPAPGDPGDDPTLPNTGGGAALLAILAMGAGAWLWRRREVQ